MALVSIGQGHCPIIVRRRIVVLVVELAGHRRLDTTRRYSLPSETDRHASVGRRRPTVLDPFR